jgi:hypothetical protein
VTFRICGVFRIWELGVPMAADRIPRHSGLRRSRILLRRDSGRLLLGRSIRLAVSLFLSRIERLDEPGDQAAEFGGVCFFGYQLAEFLDQLFRIDFHILLHLAFLHLGAD